MKASRLLHLLLLLQTRQRLTTTELAARLEVSRRTVLRDVEALSTAGVPVYAERGRNGGIVLLPSARLSASHLEPPELEALSVAGLDSALRERMGLTAVWESAERKIAARQAAAPESPSPLGWSNCQYMWISWNQGHSSCLVHPSGEDR
ncbi:helix-turn-helix transcriptional regulator [Streptomyces sioyaensis]|uniref:helix-turn-helix transcriptional regulator n=1 Tax=Streptomyces sioyaensis TaxID=67364 RepID=UPI0037A131A1